MACGCQGQTIIPAAPPIPHAPVEESNDAEQKDTSEDES